MLFAFALLCLFLSLAAYLQEVRDVDRGRARLERLFRLPLLAVRILTLGIARRPTLGSLALVLAWASFLLAPGTALADGAAAAPAVPNALLQFLVDQLSWQMVLTALGVVAGVLHLSANRKRQIALATYHAFHLVEDLSAECEAENKALPYADKATAGLAMLDKYMLAQGWRPAKRGEKELVQLTFKSLNAQADAGLAPAVIPPTAGAQDATALANTALAGK